MSTASAPAQPDLAGVPFLVRFGRFVRFSHTIFALPFAGVAMLAAADGWPGWSVCGWILLCMVSARTLAMVFNRLADWQIDQENPRTAGRHRLISRSAAKVAMVLSIGFFVFGAAMLNTLCLLLAPVAVALVCFYSITKRFTAWCHAFLGLALAAAPLGAWAAVSGTLLHPSPFILAAAVLCWVFGFDLIYATLDEAFDRKAGLHSFPVRFGVDRSLRCAVGLHGVALLGFGLFGLASGLGWYYGVAWLLCIPVVALEHQWARRGSPEEVNRAFFHANATVSVLLFVATGLDFYSR